MSVQAVFTGSFDPVTLGHLSILENTLGKIAERIVVGISNNQIKTRFLTRENAARLFQRSLPAACAQQVIVETKSQSQIRETYSVNMVIRGIRDETDLQHEMQNMARSFKRSATQTLRPLPVLWVIDPASQPRISSTLFRERFFGANCHEGELSKFVAPEALELLMRTRREVAPSLSDPSSIHRFNEILAKNLG